MIKVVVMKIKKRNKYIKAILIFLFGVEYGNKFPITLKCITEDGLRNLLYEDEFGVYKKEDVKIPLRFKRKYILYKKLREEMIYAKYYNLQINYTYGFFRQYYFFEDIEIPTGSDKIVAEKLLSKG